MKKNLLFLPLFAALALTGCSKDEVATESGSGISDGEPRYLAVSIATTPSLGESTRAVDKANDNGTYTQSNGSYEDGLAEENKVNKVRFYFFTETGAAMSVKKGSTNNYYDCTPNVETNGADHSQTVSTGLEAVLVISTKEGDQMPSSMMAVINPTTAMDKSMNRESLMNLAENYAAHSNGFMMSNSVYLDTSDNIVDDTPIYLAHYSKSPEEAQKNPVRIYVERSMAKVRVELGGNLQSKSEPTTDAKGNAHDLIALTYLDDAKVAQPLTIGEGTAKQQVYVELLGWNVDGIRSDAYAVKNLRTGEGAWTNSTAPAGMDASWNLPQLHRCFWALNTSVEGNTYFNYNELKGIPFTGTNYTYCNENAERATKTLATSVVIPARLCDKDGNSLTICEYAGVRFVDDEEFTRLKTQTAFRLQNTENFFWTKETKDGAATWRQLTKDDIEYVLVSTAPTPDINNRYYVKPQLTAAASKLKWYKSEPVDGATQEEWTPAQIAAVFAPYATTKIWKSGMTYYALFIPHLSANAASNPVYGVVRNHVYAITIDNIYGLGTPVYDPEIKIIPEKVVVDDVYLSAKVELLSWRVVPNNVTLDWGK